MLAICAGWLIGPLEEAILKPGKKRFNLVDLSAMQ